MAFLFIILDGNYPGYEVFTEPLFYFYTGPLIPGFPTNPITISLLFGIPALIKAFSQRHSGTHKSSYEHQIVIVGLPLVLIGGFSSIFGLAGGGDFRIMSWQYRILLGNLFWTFTMFAAVSSVDNVYYYLNLIYKAIKIKTVLFLGIYFGVYGGTLQVGERLAEYMSSHTDSVNYAWGIGIALFRVLFDKKFSSRFTEGIWVLTMAAPLFINERRIAIVGLMAALALSSFFIVPTLPAKVKKKLPIYGAIGAVFAVIFWFSPLNPTNSIVNEQSAGEKDYRDVENYNLYVTTGQNPIFGLGFGVPFPQYEVLPDVIKFGDLLAWIPHNTFLMTWAFTGFIGAVSLGMYLMYASAISVKTFRISDDPNIRLVGYACFVVTCQYGFYTWADMGLFASQTPCIMVGACAKFVYFWEQQRMKGVQAHA